MSSKSSDNEEIAEQERLLADGTAQLQQLQRDFEDNLQRYYKLKARETTLELSFEAWKQLYRRQEAELGAKQSELRCAKMAIWSDREQFCDSAARFVREFSLENCLARLRDDNNGNSEEAAANPQQQNPGLADSLPGTSLEAQLDAEIAKLKLKEIELDKLERELGPDEETIRRLQEAINNSASSLEQLEAEVRALDGGRAANGADPADKAEIKSILKRPSYLAPDEDVQPKQVRFE